MRKTFQLTKPETICKTCGGLGVLAFLAGAMLCLLNAKLISVGLLLYIAGIATVFEAFLYLIKPENKKKRFEGSIFVVGLGLMMVAMTQIFSMSLPVILCLAMIILGEIMILYSVN